MKKYYTAISQQSETSLKLIQYQNPGKSSILDYGQTHFPIIPLLVNTVKAGETIKIFAVKQDYQRTDYCLKVLQDELQSIQAEIGFKYEMEILDTPRCEVIESHLDLFKRLVDSTADGDRVYADITFGTKPIPMIMLMFMSFAYRCRQNTEIEHIVYGAFNHEENNAALYDVTALFYMNSVVNQLDPGEISDPAAVIRKLIDMENSEE